MCTATCRPCRPCWPTSGCGEVEAVYCLGDLVGYGPDPNGVIELIRSEGMPTVMGNYDEGVGWETGDCGCYYDSPEAKTIGEASYLFTVEEVTAENKAFLRALPLDLRVEHCGVRLHLVHGSPRKINEYLLPDRDERTFLRILGERGGRRAGLWSHARALGA